MAILNDVELTYDEERKITNSLNETEIEIIESDIILKTQDEHRNQQKHISRTIVMVLCAITAFLVFAIIVFASIFAPQH